MKIIKADVARRELPPDHQLGFGRYFTDHMLKLDFAPDRGWHDLRIEPYAPLVMDPACMALHYGQQTFEGLKAYRGVDGGLRLFRMRKHLERLAASAQRLCIPTFDVDALADGLKQLVLLDRHYVPRTEGCSLYIRPNVIAADPFLGVRPSQTYLLYAILSPVGAYFPEGFNPVSIMVEQKHVRAVPGGIGEAKTGGNYAASLYSQMEARKKGFTQVLWLDGKQHRYVEEVGTMNIFFVIGDEVVTSPLTGSILHGVTRDSVLQLLPTWGHRVSERMLSIDEVVAGAADGSLKEIFGTGTAAVISPVGQLSYQGKLHKVGDGGTGPLSHKLYETITGIQYGREKDVFGWTERIDL